MSLYYTEDELTELIAVLEANFPDSIQGIIEAFSNPDEKQMSVYIDHIFVSLNSALKNYPLIKKLGAELQAEIVTAAGGELRAGQQFYYTSRDGGRVNVRIDEHLTRLGWEEELGAQKAVNELYLAIAKRVRAIVSNGKEQRS